VTSTQQPFSTRRTCFAIITTARKWYEVQFFFSAPVTVSDRISSPNGRISGIILTSAGYPVGVLHQKHSIHELISLYFVTNCLHITGSLRAILCSSSKPQSKPTTWYEFPYVEQSNCCPCGIFGTRNRKGNFVVATCFRRSTLTSSSVNANATVD